MLLPSGVSDAITEMATELDAERARHALLASYYDGAHPLPVAPNRLTNAYRDLMRMSVSNWCRLVVDVVAERLAVATVKSSRDADQDETAWRYWQESNLDAASVGVHTEALKLGCCYVSVWPGPVPNTAAITGEHPSQVHVRYAEVGDEHGETAIKLWLRSGYLFGALFYPDVVYRFQSARKVEPTYMPGFYGGRAVAEPWTAVQWVARSDDLGGYQIDNTMGLVPFARFATMPDLLGGYTSEITPILPIQNRINKTTFDRLVSQEFTAYPQRWVTGLDVPVDKDGKPREPFNSAIDRLWVSESPETRFGQFDATTGDAYLRAIEADVQALATQSRTPPHYLTGGMGQFPSGESVRATEYGLSQKVHNRQTTYGEAWASVIRLAAMAAGDKELANDRGLAIGWADVEARSEGEIVDALLKMATLGVPRQVLWERWGATPQEAKRWAEDLAERTPEELAEIAAGLDVPPQAPTE